MIPFLLVVLAAAALSGFFSLTNSALRAFRRLQLDEAFSAPGGHEKLQALEDNLKSLRLTTALGRVLSHLLLMAGFVYLFEPAAGHGWAVVGAVAAAGAVGAIFSVAIPQAWATHAGEKALARTFGVLMFVRYVLYPVTVVLKAFDLPIRRLAGIADEEADSNGEAAKQEILQAASEGRAEGAVDADEVQMIESVMELGETHTGEIMTPRTDIFALPADEKPRQACEQLIESGHTRIPVFEGDIDNIIGVVYAKDLLEHLMRAELPSLRDVMRQPYFVPETKPLDDLLKEFKARKVHMAVALDEYGGTAGIVTIEDVLEEIVGEIADEYDRTEPASLRRVDERSVEAHGRLHIDDLNDEMGLEIPEDEDYDTIAGLIFSQLGYIPSTGETVEVHGAKFTVLAADERKITQLRVELLNGPGEEAS